MPILNIRGLKGLSAAERQDWEDSQIAQISDFKDYSEEEKDQLYRNQEFKKVFSGDAHYAEYKTWAPEERNQLFANVAFRNRYKGDENYEQLKQLSPEERNKKYVDDEIRDRAQRFYGNSKDWETISTFEPEIMEELIRGNYQTTEDVSNYFSSRRNPNVPNTLLKDYANRGGASTDFNLLRGTKAFDGDDTTWNRTKQMLGKSASSALNWVMNIVPNVALDLSQWGEELFVEPFRGDSFKAPDLHRSNLEKSWTDATFGGETSQDIMSSIYGSMLDYAQVKNNQLRIDKAQSSEMAQNFMSQYNMALQTPEGTAQVTNAWNNMVSNSSYASFMKNRGIIDSPFLNVTAQEKAKVLSTVNAIAFQYGDAAAQASLNSILNQIVTDNTGFGERAFNLACINIPTQIAGIIGEAAAGLNSLLIMFFTNTSNNYRKGFTNGGNYMDEWYNTFLNPVYWSSVAQYGTFNPNAINKYKYGVGSPEYQQAYQDYINGIQAASPDMKINPNDERIKENFKNGWISQQWHEGQFKGNLVSNSVTARTEEEASNFFGNATMDEAIGMTGQMIGQLLLAKGIGATGGAATRVATNTAARAGASLNAVNKTRQIGDFMTGASAIAAPSLAISEAYAQRNYEEVITSNRVALDNELNKPEHIQKITNLYNQKRDLYLSISNGDEQLAYKLAEAKYRQHYYNNLDKGALGAFWTSFGTEFMRYTQFNALNRQWIFGDATKRMGIAQETVKMGPKGASNTLTTKTILKNAGKEFYNSGKTNLLDETTSAFSLGFGTHQFNDYLGVYYDNNPEYNGLYGALIHGLHNSSESFSQKSTLRAGLVGSLGFLVGGQPTNMATAWVLPEAKQLTPKEINSRAQELISKGVPVAEAYNQATQMSNSEARQYLKERLGLAPNQYSKSRIALEWAEYLTGSSALQNIGRQLRESDYNNLFCNEVNTQLAADEKLLTDNETARALSNFTQVCQDASSFNDELVQKDASYMRAFTLLKTLEEMRHSGTDETETYQNFMDKLAFIENGQISDEDIDSFVNNPLNSATMALYSTDEEKAAYASSRIQKNVAKFREIEKSWEKNSKKLEEVFPHIEASDKATQDIYYDVLFKMSLQDDFIGRLANLESEISGSSKTSTTSNPIVLKAMANEGTKLLTYDRLIGTIEGKLAEIDSQISSCETISKDKSLSPAEHIRNTIELGRLRNMKSRISDQISKFNEEKAALEKAKDSDISQEEVLSAKEVLTLNPNERLFMLSHPEEFSKKQRVNIKQAQSKLLNTIGKDFWSKLRDAHLLNERIGINQQYIDYILQGEIGDAVANYHYMRTQQSISEIMNTASLALKSITPLLDKGIVTKELIAATVGMPTETLKQFANLFPKYNKVLQELVDVQDQVQFFDRAISSYQASKVDKKELQNMCYDVIANAKNAEDITKTLQSIADSTKNKVMKDAITYILNYADGSKTLQNATVEKTNSEEQSIEETANLDTDKGSKEKKKTQELAGSEEQLKSIVGDVDLGEVNSPTLEEQAPKSAISVLPMVSMQEENTLPVASVDLYAGNPYMEYDVAKLRDEGKMQHKVEPTKEVLVQFYKWLSDNNIQMQEIIDNELGDILKANPRTPIHFMYTKPIVTGVNEHGKDLMQDRAILVIENTPEVAKIHKAERGSIYANGNEYLVIGVAFPNATNSGMLNAMKDEAKRKRFLYFNDNPDSNFYIDDKYSTQVHEMTSGYLVKQLPGDTEIQYRSVAELANGEVTERNPEGLSVEDLKWGIVKGGKIVTIGVNERNVIFPPKDISQRNGAVYLFMKAANGNYIPVAVRPVMYNEISNGKLKDRINDALMRFTSEDYTTRIQAREELKTLISFNNSKTLLTKDNGTITISENDIPTTFTLGASFDRAGFMKAVNEANFRINITVNALSSPSSIRELSEAGALNTDIAKLGTSDAIYDVYTCNSDGTPKVTDTLWNQGNLTSDTPAKVSSYMLDGKTYRERNGEFFDDLWKPISKELQTQLSYLKEIEDRKLSPVIKKRDAKYYILQEGDTPVVVKVSGKKQSLTVADKETSQKTIDIIKAQNLKAQQDAAAKAEAERLKKKEEMSSVEDVDLGDIQEGLLIEQKNQEAYEAMMAGLPEEAMTKKTDSPTLITETVTKSKGDVNNIHSIIKNNLQGSEKNSNFAEIYRSAEFGARLEAIFEEKKLSFETLAEIEKWLKNNNVSTEGITDVDSWLEMIKNCR